MKISRRFTKAGQDVYSTVEFEKRSSRISNPDGSVVFEMNDAMIPKAWSQLATDIMVSKYFRKAGVPQLDSDGNPKRDTDGRIITGPEKSVRQVIHRLVGCWKHWGETHNYFDSAEDGQVFYDELAYMLLHQMCAPNSPQWFNTGLNWAYGITGPAQGHFYCDPKSGELKEGADAYTHPQPHACQPFHALISTPQGPIAIGDIVGNKLVGLQVFDGTGDGTGTTRVVAVKNNGEKPVLRINLKSGQSVEATADHLMWAIDERRTTGQWLRVDQLAPGQRMHVSTVTTVTKQSDEAEVIECGLAGWLQGDGFVGQYTEGTNRSLTMEFMTIDEDEHRYVMGAIAKVFEGVHFKVRSVSSQNTELTIRRIRLYGERLRPFVEKYALLREGSELSVPAAVRRAGAQAQCAYLAAIFQTDGTVRRRVRNGSRTCDVVLTTVSPSLAEGVQSLLLNHGIYSRIQRGVETRSNRRVPLFVSIGYADARAKFQKHIGFISESKQQKLQSACSSDFPGKALPPLREEVITTIELVGTQPVFDIQTESGQYLSNNVIVHNCFIQSVSDDLVNPGGIMDLWTREARLFKYGSGTGSNFSKLRGENEPLSGGGKSSGLMSFLKIGDRAAGAIKSGGTTRRAAKMVCLDLDHPDVESFVNWKVREELKVAALAEGMKHLSDDQKETAKKLGLKLDYDFNGESYMTVSGQNSNNSVRIPNEFFKAVESDGPWHLRNRTNGKVHKTIPARQLWDEIAYAAWRCADPGVQYDDTINQWHTCPKSGRINASNPCVTGDTRVLTPGGVWRRIDQMIHLPSSVVTNLNEQAVHVTDGSFPTGTKDIFELRTAGGYAVKLTADHKIWTRTRGWRAAKDLLPTDEIRLPNAPATIGPIGEPTDPKFFELLGVFVSDKSNDPSAVHLDSLDDIDSFAHYLQDSWQHTYNDDYPNPAMLTAHYAHHAGTERTRATPASSLQRSITNRRLLSRLKAYTDTRTLRLNDDVFTAGLAAQKHILRGLFTADGNLTQDTIEITNGNIAFLHDVQLLLIGFGIKCSVTEISRIARGNNPGRLRISPQSIAQFRQHIGLLPGNKNDALDNCSTGSLAGFANSESLDSNYDRISTLTPLGRQQVFDLTEPVTHSFIANGITVHNCSEYMFLDDTACNLASLNVLTFFDAESRRFDTEAYKHGIRLWTIVLEISVLMASFPSEEIARLSYQFRTLGLGYANLGAMLMQAGIPYDSDKGRAACAALSAILTGESYATSAEMARELTAFPGYEKNKNDMLRVIRNHKRAAYDVTGNASSRRGLGSYEALDITPVSIDASAFSDADPLLSRQMLHAAQESWDRALFLGERHGYRNAQTTVIAPTGTIGLLMDCDTTGVEPDFALVKFKKLAGGGYFKIANQSLTPALVNLGYSSDEVHEILQFVMGTLTLHGSPHVNHETLRSRGFTDAELEKIEQSLPSQFELGFAFTGWSLGSEAMTRLGIAESEWQAPGFNLLRRLGYTRKQIDDASAVICGRGTVEGAPHLREEHYAVFDCANKCGKTGKRFIAADGHIRMMAAAQPFISGAISKTINLPNEATVDEIKESYALSWKLGLKANALYRDGSKLSQPLNSKSDDVDELEDDDAENVSAAKEEIADQVATGVLTSVSTSPTALTSDNLEISHTHVIERIVERIVERPLRRRLPDTRHGTTHKFDVAGHEGYITTGLYEDGQPGEIFIRMAKEGSTIGGLMDTIATLVSVSLQYGVPVESLVRKFEHVRFEPSGMSRNPEIPMAKSLVDYIFRYLAMEFVPGYREANAPKRPAKVTPPAPVTASTISAQTTGTGATTAANGNSHIHPRLSAGAEPQSHYTDAKLQAAHTSKFQAPESHTTPSAASLRIALTADPLSQQGTEMQADAPACDVCGSITVRSGTCYKCMNCGSSMGCS